MESKGHTVLPTLCSSALKRVPLSMIITRDIESIPEISSVQTLIAEVWQVNDLDIVPLTNLVAMKEVGGILVGAFSGEELVGFALGFLGRKRGKLLIHSQMVAVKPANRNLNLGYKLKLAQRERALAQGITIMTWTFDPLQSLNAHSNFGKLGVIAYVVTGFYRDRDGDRWLGRYLLKLSEQADEIV